MREDFATTNYCLTSLSLGYRTCCDNNLKCPMSFLLFNKDDVRNKTIFTRTIGDKIYLRDYAGPYHAKLRTVLFVVVVVFI